MSSNGTHRTPVNYPTDMTSLGAANLGEFWGKRRNGRPLGSFIYVLVVNLVSLGWAAEPGKTYRPVFGRFENERRSEACVQCVAGMLISGLVRDFIENEPWVIFDHLGFIPGFILCNLECRRNLHFLEAAFRPNWTVLMSFFFKFGTLKPCRTCVVKSLGSASHSVTLSQVAWAGDGMPRLMSIISIHSILASCDMTVDVITL